MSHLSYNVVPVTVDSYICRFYNRHELQHLASIRYSEEEKILKWTACTCYKVHGPYGSCACQSNGGLLVRQRQLRFSMYTPVKMAGCYSETEACNLAIHAVRLLML